jgi:putative intracellular protease/amidase
MFRICSGANIVERMPLMAKIAVVLTLGFADWEYALIGGTGGPFYGLDVQYFSSETGKITSQGGLTVIVSQGLDELTAWQPNVVVVVGGTAWETDNAPDISSLLNAQHARGVHIAGICGGTLALARAGLLDTESHTSNDAEFLKRNAANYSGKAHYQASAAALSSGRVITAPGTAPASFTAEVFKAAGVPTETVSQFREMMAAEHS